MSTNNDFHIAFSEPQQQGVLGHALTDAKIFELVRTYGITPNMMFSTNDQCVMRALYDYHDKNKIHPSLQEVRVHPGITHEEKNIVAARLKAIDRCLEMRSEIRFEAVAPALKDWAIAQVYVKEMQESADLWARQDAKDAVNRTREMLRKINAIDDAGLTARIESAAVRVQDERQDRIEDAKFRCTYGLTYLDEILHGISRRELVLIGAYSGKGKTQFATMLAAANVKQGKKVAYIALEADPKEIERRLLFPLILKKYRAHYAGKPMPYLDYGAWYKFNLDPAQDKILEPLEAQAVIEFQAEYQNLTTVSRSWGNYGLAEVERDIQTLAKDHDLIVLDHIHVIDTDDKNENRELTDIMHRLGALARSHGVPIVAAAHLRKPNGPEQLIPDQHAFHGSSNMVKVANTAIMLVPTTPGDFHVSGEYEKYNAYPTLVSIPKSRTGGSMTGVVLYEPIAGTYLKAYSVGYVNGRTKWTASQKVPPFQKSPPLEVVQVVQAKGRKAA